ncbi:MAG: amidohydrolase family protein [Victivallales bacterium]|nr:amidohydrolase family protein [Victivallales bacterium]
MIIDAHAHLCSNPAGLDEIAASGRLEQVWLMDVSGCELRTNPFASEAEVLQTAKDYPGFFIPFGYLDLRKTPDNIDRLKDKGFFGLKAYRPLKPYSDPEYFPFYERAAKLNMPILFHTGLLEKCPKGQMANGLSFGPENMRPAYLAAIAAAFPDLTIIGGHLGYPWLEETAQNLYYYPNIYHDLSGYRKDIEWLIKNLDRKCTDGDASLNYFSDKILFASDALCYGNEKGHREAFRLMDFWELFLEMVGGNYYRWGNPEERAKIMGGNALKLYNGIKNGKI